MFSRISVIILLVVTAAALPVFGDGNREQDAWEKFALGLELIIDRQTDEAMGIMESIITDFPETGAAVKAKEYLDNYSGKLDRSGIVPFYLGNMITATWAAYSIPMILDLEDGVILGTTGILGVGAGIYSSWLMTRNRDMSLGQDLWIEFAEAASVANFQYAYNIFGKYIDDFELRGKINIGGQAVTSLVSRGLSYKYTEETTPSTGKIFTVINTYAWSQYYLWIMLSEIINSDNDNLNNALGIVIPDLAALGSYYLWDKGGWSLQRTGIVSVSGIGGLLTGIFVNMIIDEAGVNPSNAVSSSIILGSSLAGKIIGAFATGNMEPDSKAEKSLFENLSFVPIVNRAGNGFMINLSY